jgi:hypothetical protein
MTTTPRIVLAAAVAAVALVACGGSDRAAPPDSPQWPDSDGIVMLPTWRLEDIQPASPRVGQAYGLDTFSAKIVVVTLSEGF